MSNTKYRVVAEVAEGRQRVGDGWETRFVPTVVTATDDYEAASAAVADFRAAGRGGEGKTFRNVYILMPGEPLP